MQQVRLTIEEQQEDLLARRHLKKTQSAQTQKQDTEEYSKMVN